MLQIVDVTRVYDDGHVRALRNVSLVIQGGEYLAIMGPSGSGKSTLLNLLGALDQPTSGRILFEGVALQSLRDLDHFRASTLGFIFQSFYLLPTLTALENVQIPMFETSLDSRRRAKRAGELLEVVGMTPRRIIFQSNFRSVNVNAWQLPALWQMAPNYYWLTSRREIWIPIQETSCWICLIVSTANEVSRWWS